MRLSALRKAITPLTALTTATLLLAGCTASDTSKDPEASAPATAPPQRAPDWPERPRSVAAVGDSITRGFDACSLLSDCPEVSWVTGTDERVDSLAARLLGRPTGARSSSDSADSTVRGSWNLARSGASMAELPGQMRQAAARDPDLVAVLIGANDACRPTVDRMTPVADFRADFEAALAVLHRTAPEARVLVGSIPDLEQLWRVGREHRLAKQVWQLGICPSMLSNAGSTAPADRERRSAVSARVDAYNEVLEQTCAATPTCIWDGGAVHRFRFTTEQLSPWDWFHPSVDGQAELARILYRAAFGSEDRDW